MVKFQSSTGSTVNIDDFKVQLTANAGNNVGTNTLNVTWFNWVDATSQTNPVWANRVGSLSVPSSSVSASFTTYLVCPGSFSPSPIPALSTGSSYFFRIWSQGGNSNQGYGLKVLRDNIDLQYNVTSTSIDVYNYNGTTFSVTPASTFTPVPEPSTYLLCGLASAVMVWSQRRRFHQS